MQTKRAEYLRKTIETMWHGSGVTETGSYPKIVQLYKELLKIEPKDRDAWENMIWMMWSLSINQKDEAWMIEAHKFVKMYLSVMPNGYRSFEYVGMFYRSMYKDEKLAIRYYESAIRFKDCPPTTYNSLIALLIKNNDKRTAINVCKQALKKYPNDAYTKSKMKELLDNITL